MVLDSWIIDDINRKEERRRGERKRPRVYRDISDRVPSSHEQKRDDGSNNEGGVIIIPSTDKEPEYEEVINLGDYSCNRAYL